MANSHDDLVDRQFGPRANAYVTSAVHAAGIDLDRIEEAARARPGSVIVDLGCGGGHVSYRVAPHARQVIACDLSAEMLDAVRREAETRGFDNIVTRREAAESLSLPDASADMVLCRFSAHHWHDLDAGLRAARRVLKPDGVAIFVDGIAPAGPLLDTHLQTVELLRDTSHVRDYRVDEWIAALGRAGFAVTGIAAHRLPMQFESWTARMRTPPAMIAAIRALQQGAARPVIDFFEIGEDGSFMLDVAQFDLRPV